MKRAKLSALLLTVLMLIPAAVSCTSPGDNPPDTTASDSDTVGSSVETENASSLPEMNWNGEDCLILGRDGLQYTQFTNFEIWREDYSSADVVGDAVFKRNLALEEKYGFIVRQQLVENTASTAQITYLSGEDIYDLVIYRPHTVQAHASAGYLLDLYDLKYIDLTHDCWNQTVNSQLCFGNKLYYTTSDFLLEDKNRTYLMFYNREMARSYGYGYLEDMVDAGTWTVEEFIKIIKSVSADVGTEAGKIDSDDIFGVGIESYGSFNPFLYATGFRLSTMDSENMPVLVGSTPRINDLIDMVLGFYADKTLVISANDLGTNDAERTSSMFCDSKTLFYTGFPSSFDTSISSNCNFEFGIMPFPKADTAQESYYTTPNITNGSLFGIPFTVGDSERAGFFLQALSEASTDTTLYAFYETKCKLQDSYDERCSNMLDLIFENVVYDIIEIGDFGGLRSLIENTIGKEGTNVFNSRYAAMSRMAQTQMNKVFESYSNS